MFLRMDYRDKPINMYLNEYEFWRGFHITQVINILLKKKDFNVPFGCNIVQVTNFHIVATLLHSTPCAI